MKPLVYYAHSKLIYDTEQEDNELACLKRSYKVFNPNTDIGEKGGIIPYLHAIGMCERVVVSCPMVPGCEPFHVGKGCYHEVCYAFALNFPINFIELQSEGTKYCLKNTPIRGIVLIDRNDWKKNYAKLLL